jgi:hypothetical protein
MICDIEYCSEHKTEERGNRTQFGYLCDSHNDEWIDLQTERKVNKYDHASVLRRLYVEFCTKQKALSVAKVPAQRSPW